MNGFKAQGAQKPTAFTSLLQASCYGATIPVIYGQTQSPLLAIWAANLRQGGGSIKKFKQFKKGITNYCENIDFLLGHNPIMCVLQVLVNGGNYPLDFLSKGAISLDSIRTIGAEAGVYVRNPFPPPTLIPDPLTYAIIAVTVPQTYSFAVNDYGGQGPQTLTGTFEVPCWNEFEQGPDPTHGLQIRNWPYIYGWEPSMGALFTLGSELFAISGNVNVYYAELIDATSFIPPITKLLCTFENQLGNGDEYADAPSPFNGQQIIYPHFAGLGSSQLDLGASGAIPQLLPEVRGKWGIYPSGDCDYVDIIEDIFKSGLAQAAIQAAPATTQMERGLSSYDLPGCIQIRGLFGIFYIGGGAYNMQNAAGNMLVVTINCEELPSSAMTISSTNSEVWTAVFSGIVQYQVWYAVANGGGLNTVSITNAPSRNNQCTLLEIAGVDTFDSITIGRAGTASVTTTNQQNFAGYLLSVAFGNDQYEADPQAPPLWDAVAYGVGLNGQLIQERRVNSPGTYSITVPGSPLPAASCLLAFKATQPASYPMPLGSFLDIPSLELTRTQDRANGLWGSLSMSSQSAASDYLKSLYQAANAAPVYLGSKLYSLPYSEVSTAGNGALYTAPTASGPIANLNADNGDFVKTPDFAGVNRIGFPNVLQMQCIDRNANYNQVVVQQSDAASIALYGVRKADPIVNNAVQDPSIARQLLAIQVRKNQYGGDEYSFSLSARWTLLSPMDLVTLTDTLQGLVGMPVRILTYNEQEDGSFEGTAEPFIYGMYAPTLLNATTPIQNQTSTTTPAGDVNAPVIFEPVPDLYPSQTGDQIWVVVSSANENYGGAAIFVSTDGGSSYNAAPGLNGTNVVIGSAVTGVTTADWPGAADPDSTNNLLLNLAESNGVLQSWSTVVENNFEYPCYVQAANAGLEVNGTIIANGNPLNASVSGTPDAEIGTVKVNGTAVAESGSAAFGYELMTYAIATLTSANHFTLMATGSGNFLRRAVFGAPDAGTGVDHAIGSRFALLSPSGTGILKMNMPLAYIGQTLFFKVLSFNTFGAALQSLSDVPAYSYVPTGIPGSV